ncbi:TSUP family transporter [Streptosporangium algeriense]|uniref:Probable membrane transporter protein n=1 Tax=Streptosporangium algeriense TaxID=1682748 RepID=A0ABW3DNF8_9ACTN
MALADALPLLALAVAAGWIDAVVGGGGLVQIPALMLAFPGMPPAVALGTNKVASIAGTAAAAVSYARKTKLSWNFLLPAAGLATGAAALGALAASAVPAHVFRPATIALLVLIAVVVVLKPTLGQHQRPAGSVTRQISIAALAGCAIGFYDGVFGPGTGMFLIFTFTLFLGLDLVHASASAKIVNVGTNLGALIVFALQGQVLWLLGLGMAVCNIIGASIGARMALRRGTKFVRAILLLGVGAMTIRLALLQLGLLGQ